MEGVIINLPRFVVVDDKLIKVHPQLEMEHPNNPNWSTPPDGTEVGYREINGTVERCHMENGKPKWVPSAEPSFFQHML